MESTTIDDWEYEYDQNERETFLIDLDLTTVNRTIRSTTANRHKRLLEIPDKSAAKRKKTSTKIKSGGAPDTVNNLTDALGSAEVLEREADGQHQAPSAVPEGEAIEDEPQPNGFQILDLHTTNPIVSYKGQIFSCSWRDMIGTTMFFSEPKETPLYDPDISTNDFDLIGMSRIKLVGYEAKVTPIPPKAKETAGDTSATGSVDNPERPGQSLGTIRRSNAKVNADLRKQANFLEQLMNIKKNRGENDNVHVVMNNKISKVVAADKLRFHTQRREEEIEQLNRKVVRGDAEALRKLEQIYLGQDVEESGDDAQIEGETPNLMSRPRRRRRSPVQIIDSGDEIESDHRPRIVGTATPSSESRSPGPKPISVAPKITDD